MAEFLISMSNQEVAAQVSDMVNKYNKWYMRFSAQSILMMPARYFIEVEGPLVVGCASSIKDYPALTRIQHICVLPTHRKRGIARKLTEIAIKRCDTEYVYMTIRDDNFASIGLATSLGFVYVKKHWFRDHWTLTFGRRREHARAALQN